MLEQKHWRTAIAITTLAALPFTALASDYEDDEEELEDEAQADENIEEQVNCSSARYKLYGRS